MIAILIYGVGACRSPAIKQYCPNRLLRDFSCRGCCLIVRNSIVYNLQIYLLVVPVLFFVR
jgi:hypothetical protein